MENKNEKYYWDIAFSGIQRFFDEGMLKWEKQKFFDLFPSQEMALSSYVTHQLLLLEKEGKIVMKNTDEFYFLVIKL